MVPDSDVSLRVAFEAALAADVGDRGVLERLAAEAVAGASASASAAASAGESARSAERSAEAAAASEVAAGDARKAAESAAGRAEKAAAASEDSAREGTGAAEAAKAASSDAESDAGRAEAAAQAASKDAKAAGVSASNAAADADRAKSEADRARQIAGGDFAPTVHTHTVKDITDLPEVTPTAKAFSVPLREYDTMIRVDGHKQPQYPGHLTHKKYVDDAINGVRGELEVLNETPPFKGAALEAVRRASGLLLSGGTKKGLSVDGNPGMLKIETPHPAMPPHLVSGGRFVIPVDGRWKVRLWGARWSGKGEMGVNYSSPDELAPSVFPGATTSDTGQVDVTAPANGGHPLPAGTAVYIQWRGGEPAKGMNYSLTVEYAGEWNH